ncbi:MAG: tetratricopeptide repeat protein, partial [Caldilineaceae bacterium]|nr:tetratricopeptide repeat protein [Caldilineaceae bacterium]
LTDESATDNLSLQSLLPRILVAQAFFANALADYDIAIAVAREVIDAAAGVEADMRGENAMSEVPVIATAHLRWGEALWYKGEIETAQPHLMRALTLVDAWGATSHLQHEIKADALCVLGLIAVRTGDYAAAINAYAESHQLSERLGDAYRTGRALYSLGTVYRNQAHYTEARGYLAQGLTIAQQTGDRHSESRVLNSLGDIELYQGNFRQARDYYTAVADFAAIVGDRRSECIAQTNLGIVARDLGQYDTAIREFNESLTLARTIGFPRGEGWTLCCLSLLHFQRRQHRDALRFAREALALFDHLGDRLGQAFAQTNLGRAYQGMRSWQDAQRAFDEAKRLRFALGQPHLAIEATTGLAVAAWGRGDPVNALAHVEEILGYLYGATLEGSEVPSTVYATCYQILQALGDPRAAAVFAEAEAFHQSRAARLAGDEQRTYLAASHQASIALTE